MPANALRRPNARLSAGAAHSQLAMLLAGCTDEKLAGFTAEGLAQSYRVRTGECAAMLEQARGRRHGLTG